MKATRVCLPDLLIHPGETLHELMVERCVSCSDLAQSTGFSEKYISDVVACCASITPAFAFALEGVWQVSSSFWLHLQQNYDLERGLSKYENLQ